MNILELNTKEKLDEWKNNFLVVTDGINDSQTTGFKRAVALFDFNASFRDKNIQLVCGIYELDSDGNPIISKSLRPYEELIIATNSKEVDIETMDVVPKEQQVSGKTYLGEFDAYVMLTKTSPVKLWELFESVIKRSSTINPK